MSKFQGEVNPQGPHSWSSAGLPAELGDSPFIGADNWGVLPFVATTVRTDLRGKSSPRPAAEAGDRTSPEPGTGLGNSEMRYSSHPSGCTRVLSAGPDGT